MTRPAPTCFDSVLGASDYSVDPAAIGRMVEVNAAPERVRVCLDGKTVADHR